MTISATPFPSGMISDGEIPVGKLAYFRERLRNRLHEVVFLEFLRQEDTYGLTKAELARRIAKPPERITRLLAAPGNWTLDTVSDLLLGLGSELDFSAALLVEKIAKPRAIGIAQQISSARQRPSLREYASPPPQQIPPATARFDVSQAPPQR